MILVRDVGNTAVDVGATGERDNGQVKEEEAAKESESQA